MQAQARVMSKGRVTIPRDIRRALGVEQGDMLIFEVTDGRMFEVTDRGVRLRPRHAGTVRAFVGASRIGSGKTVAEIVAEMRELRDA